MKLPWIFKRPRFAVYQGVEPLPRFEITILRRLTPDQLEDFELRLLANLSGNR